jgi:SOS response regulatory protein OraA/RecX
MSPRPRQRRTRAQARERHASVTEIGPVMDAAARFLEARPRSVAETRRRLADAGYAAPLVEDALARLTRLGYLDDDAFARAWVESRDRAHPRGEAVLRRELHLKGIDPGLIAAVLEQRRLSSGSAGAADADADGDAVLHGGHPRRWPGSVPSRLDPELEAALRLLQRRASPLQREPDPRRRRQKAYALLARQGFDPGTCRTALETWWAAAGPASAAMDDAPDSDGAPDSTAHVEDV